MSSIQLALKGIKYQNLNGQCTTKINWVTSFCRLFYEILNANISNLFLPKINSVKKSAIFHVFVMTFASLVVNLIIKIVNQIISLVLWYNL